MIQKTARDPKPSSKGSKTMSLPIFLKAMPFDKTLVTLGLESGVDGILTDKDAASDVLALGRTTVVTENDWVIMDMSSRGRQEQAAQAMKSGRTVLLTSGWEIIPVENLLALNKGRLGLEVLSREQAVLAAGILERGVDFLVVAPEGQSELKQIVQDVKMSQGSMKLEKATLTAIRPAGLGHRVCVDTCSMLKTGQGLLVGNSSSFTFLVHGETEANPYVAARPFRINAGAVHAYVVGPKDRTSYLEELRAGDPALTVHAGGQTELATVGRIKIEVRPLLLVSARVGQAHGQIFLQNAETIRLVRSDGTPASVVALKEGDQVLCRTDQAGRHFGMRIAEQIEEK